MDGLVNDRWEECSPWPGTERAQLLRRPGLCRRDLVCPTCSSSYVKCTENTTIIKADTTTSKQSRFPDLIRACE